MEIPYPSLRVSVDWASDVEDPTVGVAVDTPHASKSENKKASISFMYSHFTNWLPVYNWKIFRAMRTSLSNRLLIIQFRRQENINIIRQLIPNAHSILSNFYNFLILFYLDSRLYRIIRVEAF